MHISQILYDIVDRHNKKTIKRLETIELFCAIGLVLSLLNLVVAMINLK